jgi:hypothetical protein
VSEVFYSYYFLFLSFPDSILQCSTGWLSTLKPPASVSRVLGLQAITITPSFDVFLKCTLLYIYCKDLLTICFHVPFPILFIIVIYFTSTCYFHNIYCFWQLITFFKKVFQNYKCLLITFSKSLIHLNTDLGLLLQVVTRRNKLQSSKLQN